MINWLPKCQPGGISTNSAYSLYIVVGSFIIINCCNRILLFVLKLIFNSETWRLRSARHADNLQLSSLAGQLPSILLSSRAPSTVSHYSAAFTRWQQWVRAHGESSLPGDPYMIALYLVHVGNSAASPSPVLSASAAISWAHRMAGPDDPTKYNLIVQVSEGLKRTLAKPRTRKEPITPDILIQLEKLYGTDRSIHNLMNIRTLAMAQLSFAGFLRFNELAAIKMADLTFHHDYLSIQNSVK